MINLKNECNQFKLKFEEFKESFKKYEENHKKYLSDLKELTGRDGKILTRDIKPTDRYISQAERDIRINQKRYSRYEAAIAEIDNYMNDLEYGDALDNAVDFINKLQSIIDSLPQKSAVFPKKNLSSTPLIQQAVWSLYSNKLEMNEKFHDLNEQYFQLSEVANKTLQVMNEPHLSDCFNSYESETMMIEQMAILDSVDSSSSSNTVFEPITNQTIYFNHDIYLGIQY